jgi:hypothetical protein
MSVLGASIAHSPDFEITLVVIKMRIIRDYESNKHPATRSQRTELEEEVLQQ